MKSSFRITWNLARKYWYWIVVVALLDLAFLWGFGVVYAYAFQFISVHLGVINDFLAQNLAGFASGGELGSLSAGLDDFNAAVNAVKFGIGVVLASLLVLWLVFEGLAWFLIHRICHLGNSFWGFCKDFLLATLAGFAVFLGIVFFGVWLGSGVLSTGVPLLGSAGIKAVMFVLTAVLLYFLFSAYSVIGHGHLWKSLYDASIRRVSNTGVAFLLVLVVVSALYVATIAVVRQGVLAGFVFGLIFFLPGFTIMRIFFLNATNKKYGTFLS